MKKNIIIAIVVTALITAVVTAVITISVLNSTSNNKQSENADKNENVLAYEEMENNKLIVDEEVDITTTNEIVEKNEVKNEAVVENEPVKETNKDTLQDLAENTETNQVNKEPVAEEPRDEYIEDYRVAGYMKIPKNNVEAPILDRVSVRSLELSIAIAYGPGLNEVGNTTIYGHAYQNYPFEKLSNLVNGDLIIIKDSSKEEITYEVYDRLIVPNNDATFMIRDTNGARELSLQTGASGTEKLIILAREVNK